MQAMHQEILPPSGVEFATTLKLTPATLAESATPSTSTSYPHPSHRALYNVVVARANILRIFEVTENPAPISDVLRGTEAAEDEVEMDEQGEGFVNMGSVKVTFMSMTCLFPMIVVFLFFSPTIIGHEHKQLS